MDADVESGVAAPPQPTELVTVGFLRRLLAGIVDFLVAEAFWGAVWLVLWAVGFGPDTWTQERFSGWAPLAFGGAACVTIIAYVVVMLGRFGWTLGMRLLNIRVCRADGSAIGYGRAAARTLALAVPAVLPFLPWPTAMAWGIAVNLVCLGAAAGLAWLVIDGHHQGYHDKIAGTFVVLRAKPLPSAAAATEPPAPLLTTRPASRRLRVAKWAAFAVLCLVSLVPLGIEVAAYLAEREVNAILAELKAEGKPITSADLAPPPVPDAENAALVYEEAHDKLQWSEGEEKLLTQAVSNWTSGRPLGHGISKEQLERMKSGLGYEYPHGPSSAPEKRFVPAEELPEVQRQAGEATDAQILAAAKEGLHRNQEVLALVERATAMPECRFDIDWSQGMSALFPQFAWLRGDARLLELQAMALCEEGKADEALQATAQMVDLSNSLKGTPNLISLLVRVSIDSMALGAVERTIYDSTPSPNVCRVAEAVLARVEFRGALVRALEAKRAMDLDVFEGIREGRPGMSARNIGGELDMLALWGGRYPTHCLPYDTLFLLKGMELYIERAKLPFFERDSRLPPELERVRAQLESPFPFPPRILSLMLLPAYDGIPRRVAQGEANVGLARVALLLKAYRGEQGHYPESLEELARYEGKELPLDPCSGQPFHYRRNGSGFILYSVGTDGVDDGGKVSVRAGQEGPIPPLSSQKGADIVWVCKE